MSETVTADLIVPVDHTIDRKCTARSKSTGKRCTRDALRGGTVCYVHGGAAPQVIAKARLRMLMAADPMVAVLIMIAKDKKQPAAARVSAANSLLDRAGLKPDADLQAARAQAIRVSVEAQRNGDDDPGDDKITVEFVNWTGPVESGEGKSNGHG